MKKKIYNFFLIIFIFLFILEISYFFYEKKQKSQLLDLLKINSNIIQLDNLTDKEKEVLIKFNSIPQKDYQKKYKEISNNNEIFFTNPSKNNIDIYILTKLLESNTLSQKAKLYIFNELRVLNYDSKNIVNAIKLNLNYLNLAETLNSKYDIARAKLSLSSIFTNLGGYKISINILEHIDIQNEDSKQFSRIKIYLNFYLSQNYLLLGEYEKSLKYLRDIPKFLTNENIDYKNNILVLQNLLDAYVYLALDNKEASSNSLECANNALKKIDKIYFTDLTSFYLLVSENYNLKYNFKNFSEENIKIFISEYQSTNKIPLLKMAFKLLFQFYYDSNNFVEYRNLGVIYENLLEKITTNNNKIFTLFVIESLEKENLFKQTKNLYRNIIILAFFSSIFLISFYKRIIYLDKKSKIDALTDIGNRLAFNDKIMSLDDKDYFMLIFDIDNFKIINDTFGHDFGDEVLKKIGDILKDISNKEISVFRIGGEEFIVIFTHFNRNFAMDSCEYIRKTIEKTSWKHSHSVTISGGFSEACDDVYVECDKKLYKAKSLGKNIIVYEL